MTTLTALALPLGDLRDQASNVPQAAPVINNGCSDPDVAQRDDDLAQTFIRRFEGVLDLVARSKILRAEMELAQLNDMAAALPRTTTTSSTKVYNGRTPLVCIGMTSGAPSSVAGVSGDAEDQ